MIGGGACKLNATFSSTSSWTLKLQCSFYDAVRIPTSTPTVADSLGAKIAVPLQAAVMLLAKTFKKCSAFATWYHWCLNMQV